jgi:hypothetical protein
MVVQLQPGNYMAFHEPWDSGDKLTDECSLAALAGTDQHDNRGVRERSGYTLC